MSGHFTEYSCTAQFKCFMEKQTFQCMNLLMFLLMIIQYTLNERYKILKTALRVTGCSSTAIKSTYCPSKVSIIIFVEVHWGLTLCTNIHCHVPWWDVLHWCLHWLYHCETLLTDLCCGDCQPLRVQKYHFNRWTVMCTCTVKVMPHCFCNYLCKPLCPISLIL